MFIVVYGYGDNGTVVHFVSESIAKSSDAVKKYLFEAGYPLAGLKYEICEENPLKP